MHLARLLLARSKRRSKNIHTRHQEMAAKIKQRALALPRPALHIANKNSTGDATWASTPSEDASGGVGHVLRELGNEKFDLHRF